MINTHHQIKQFDTTKVCRNAYKLGYLRCRGCGIFIKNVKRCPCCQSNLANMPRNAKSKRL